MKCAPVIIRELEVCKDTSLTRQAKPNVVRTATSPAARPCIPEGIQGVRSLSAFV